MDKYIKLQDAIDKFAKVHSINNKEYEMERKLAEREFAELPAIEASEDCIRPSGKWICNDSDKCSVCGWEHVVGGYHKTSELNYCPNCGTEMNEVEQ